MTFPRQSSFLPAQVLRLLRGEKGQVLDSQVLWNFRWTNKPLHATR
jgi:hypothetical protein